MVPTAADWIWLCTNSPRIRGDGPQPPTRALPIGGILPVFAGMVPIRRTTRRNKQHSPRIRGDGPCRCQSVNSTPPFSPYSRGWSPMFLSMAPVCAILPVFAGMVPSCSCDACASFYSPRIRGDGPSMPPLPVDLREFSPYSRGWSPHDRRRPPRRTILPVFAGMVPQAAPT